MRTKRKDIDSKSTPEPAYSKPDLTSEPVTPGGQRVVIGWIEDENGKIQWDRIRAKSREQMKKFFENPEIRAEFGSKTDEKDEIPTLFPVEWAEKLLEGSAVVEALIAEKAFGIQKEEAAEILAYSDEEKELLAGPIVKILSKRAPKWLVQWQDEIQLLTLWGSMFAVKITMLRSLNEKKAARTSSLRVAPSPSTLYGPADPEDNDVSTQGQKTSSPNAAGRFPA